MKRLIFFMVLIIGILSANFAKSQKVFKNCDPEIPLTNWIIVHNTPVSDDIDFSKIKPVPVKEGSNFNETFKDEANTGISACCLDFLLKNQGLIPIDWQKNVILFTGTVYKEDGKYFVYRTMFYDKDQKTWLAGKNYIDYTLDNTCKATYQSQNTGKATL